VRTPPEELVNSASPELAFRFQRSRDNQPVPTFPRSPGIIRETRNSDLTLGCRFVLSMNCDHSSTNLISAHHLICTGYPPKPGSEKVVDKQYQPIKSMHLLFSDRKLFTGILA
jgi:hypothetical protein